jgi:hypothetical protein
LYLLKAKEVIHDAKIFFQPAIDALAYCHLDHWIANFRFLDDYSLTSQSMGRTNEYALRMA